MPRADVGGRPAHRIQDAFTQSSAARKLLDDVPCGYVSTLPDGRIVHVNRTFLTSTGYRSEELIGHQFQDLLSPGDRIFYETHYAPLLHMQGSVGGIAVEILRADGGALLALLSSTAQRGADGRPELIRTAVFEATDRREYERELIRARLRAEDSEARARVLAQTLQANLIPPTLPAIPGLDVAAVYRPAGVGAEVGGDFYDVFETRPADWIVVVGDVEGKGAEAAVVTALLRHTIRAAAIQARRPSLILSTLSAALLGAGTDRFSTVVLARLRRGSGGSLRLTVASGGHPLPLRITGNEAVATVGRPGHLLGVLDTPKFHDTSIELREMDVLVFYTDGMTEARRGGDAFGEKRVGSVLAASRGESAALIAEGLVDRVVEFQGGLPQDDIAVVVVKVPRRSTAS